MIRLEMKRSIATSKGERKIRDRIIMGELNAAEEPHNGLRSPLVAVINSQKKATIVLIEPTNSPNAKGSLPPPVTFIVENMRLGEKITDLLVAFMPSHNPHCKRLSHGVACLFSVLTSSPFLTYSNLLVQLGHLIHLVLGGISSSGIRLV